MRGPRICDTRAPLCESAPCRWHQLVLFSSGKASLEVFNRDAGQGQGAGGGRRGAGPANQGRGQQAHQRAVRQINCCALRSNSAGDALHLCSSFRASAVLCVHAPDFLQCILNLPSEQMASLSLLTPVMSSSAAAACGRYVSGAQACMCCCRLLSLVWLPHLCSKARPSTSTSPWNLHVRATRPPLPGLHAPYTSRTSYTLLGAHYIPAFPNQTDRQLLVQTAM